jgi:hypothetical protein
MLMYMRVCVATVLPFLDVRPPGPLRLLEGESNREWRIERPCGVLALLALLARLCCIDIHPARACVVCGVVQAAT